MELRSIHDSIGRRITARAVILVTALLLIASWIFPHWMYSFGLAPNNLNFARQQVAVKQPN
jgi:hypothetical protein